MTSVHFQGKPFNNMVIKVYALTSNAEDAEVKRSYEDLQNLLQLTQKKRYPFHYRGLERKSGKSRNTWSNRQIWPWCTEWSRAKANRVFPREHTGHSKHPLPTTKEKTLHMDVNKIRLIIFFTIKHGEALYSQQKTRPGADCGSDHELLIAKFRLKLKKLG